MRCLDDLQICSSDVFFINNPDLILGLKPDPDLKKKKINNFGSTTLFGAFSPQGHQYGTSYLVSPGFALDREYPESKVYQFTR